MPVKEFLDSDRVNFLIWRYLLEGDYRETAAKFQKEWHIQAPHRHFDFAPHVKNRALISVVNKGLQYYALERELISQDKAPHDEAAAAASVATEAEQQGLFGPLLAQPPHKVEEDEDVNITDNQEMDLSRKRPVESRPSQLINGSPPKRPKPNHGRYENGADAETTAPVPMEVDHTYPSPQGDQAPIIRTEGPEQGTQVEKVEELAPRTTFLRLMTDDGDNNANNSILTSSSSTPPPPSNGESAPILLHCEWNPQNPSLLAAAGTDALARIWTVARGTAPEPAAPNHVLSGNRPYHNLIDDETPRSSPVTAIAWTGGGHAIAVATEHGNKARINIWSERGEHIDRFEGLEPPVIKLRWNHTDVALLAIAPDANGAVVVVYNVQRLKTISFVLQNHDLNNWPLDAAWITETDFLLCGGDVLLHLQCTDTSINLVQKYTTAKDDDFRQVLFDRRSRLAATCGDRGTLDLWNEVGERRTISAHSGAITAMQWQPLQADGADEERLIATGGDDCAILIWNARMPESKPKCYFTMESPIVALAFTPDGAFIAGATAGHILIWKVGDSTVPRASWSRVPHPGWLSPKTASESDEEDEHCLCWDATGQKLAYGFNSRLAVINFR